MGCGSGSGGCSSGGCSSGGCSTMSVHDWLSNVTMPGDPFNVVEVEFKGGRKSFFRNTNNFVFSTGDQVVVDSGSGHDVGKVSLQGELVRLQMKKKKVRDNDEIAVVYRIASKRDIERHREAKNREMITMFRGREIISSLKLKMKLSDVEFQSDNTKATFFYSADVRVDFRELIKSLASEFKIRVEMRQISLRQEAAKVGGIGSCGRELCCTTWISDFKTVSTSAARYQNLSLNPQKLSGQCGRLKCCLNYELDTYVQELKDIPKVERVIKTEDGDAFLQKTDIFKKLMWFGYKGDSTWHVVPTSRVEELIRLNKKGIVPHSLKTDENEEVQEVAVNHDLMQLDKKYRSKEKKSRKQSKVNNRKKKNPSQAVDRRQPNEIRRKSEANENNSRPRSKGSSKKDKEGQKSLSFKSKSRVKKSVQSDVSGSTNKKDGAAVGLKNQQLGDRKKVQEQRKPKNAKTKDLKNEKPRPQRNRVKLQRQGVVDNESKKNPKAPTTKIER